MKRVFVAAMLTAVLSGSLWAAPAGAAGNPMKLVGALNPWKDGQFSNIAADSTRNVAYLGSYDDQGVAVINTTNPTAPVLAGRLSTHITSDADTSDSADLDLVGPYLAISHQIWNGNGFEGVSVYETFPDPYHPTLVRRIVIPGGVHTVQIDPYWASGRPYIYANSEGNNRVTIANFITGAIVGTYSVNEPLGCQPSGDDCRTDVFAHEGFIQRHPQSGKILDYVSYWDAGLRIVDVTNPATPVEVGSFDYGSQNGFCCAHYAAPTPSANWIYQEDEVGVGGTGGIHVLNASGCDGTTYCTPQQVGYWHINGHPVQAASYRAIGLGSTLGVIQRFFSFDAHNLDVKGENTLLTANYSMGIRQIDTTDKTSPVGNAFYLPNANKNLACNQNCFFQGRETWGAYYQPDSYIYASDFWLGFFIVNPN